MRIKNILMAGVVAITSISLPTLANAETSYATPQELLIEALEVAVSGVESTTYDEALDYVESLITVNGYEVSYDGDVIGYWDSANSNTLFADSVFTYEVLSNGGTNIWEFAPDILSPMLTDFNNKLVETIVPTTEDWSKIIGKYDVTLGSTTIPASQWVVTGYSGNSYMPIQVDKEISITQLSAIDKESINKTQNKPNIYVGAYRIDSSGKLWLTDSLLRVWSYDGYVNGYATTLTGATSLSWYTESGTAASTAYGGSNAIGCDYIKVGLRGAASAMGYSDTVAVSPYLYFTNITNDDYLYATSTGFFYNAQDPTVRSQADLTAADTVGVYYFTGDETSGNTLLQSFFTSQSSSKKQIGNTTLKQRLSKFSSLVEGDTVEVTPTTWTIRGLGGEESDFDTYLGSQDIMAPGEETSIPATADIEALAFKVVLPTSLPIYVNELNQVSVATNATIKNESGAAVIINSVSIEAKQDSGWTLLTSGTPSKARDAKEFTFTTDLAANTVLAAAEERPFRYNAELSPSTEGVEQLDLAEVLVTIDWAEVTP